MRVGIIAANNIRYSPYIFFYTSILKDINAEYELIIADRYGLKEPFDGRLYKFTWNRKQKTLINNFRYARYVKKILSSRQYDYVIVLTSINAVLLATWLKKHYFQKYIVDIRDYSHENLYPYFLLETKAVKNSLMNVISSAKFTEFLPRAKYYVCHNYDEKNKGTYFFRQHYNPITIGYVGGLSYIEQCRKLMGLVAGDERFTLEFYGTSTKEKAMKEAATYFMCDRIRFHGGYAPDEKAGILQKVDILFNAYGKGVPLLDYALSNKLYDALIYRKPILTCPDTYMTEMAGPLAFPIDLPNEKSLEPLYEWYQSIDGNTVDTYAANKMEFIEKENKETKERVAACLLQKAI